jgi:hypothetical protein
MTGRGAIIGLCMLCALAFSAAVVQSASAAVAGTTAFTCLKKAGGVGPETFSKEHCKKGEGPGEYGHFSFAQDTTTEITVTNANTNAATNGPESSVLKETIGGVNLELTSTEVTGTGTLENKKDAATNEHYISGTAVIEYKKTVVTAPSGKGCKVFTDNAGTPGAEGVVDAHVNATTTGQGDSIKFEPATGATFATFFVSGCSPAVPAIEGTWEITGSATCKPDGATIVCDHEEITKQKTLKGKGNTAGFKSKVTISGRDPLIDPPGVHNPLSVTTVETP